MSTTSLRDSVTVSVPDDVQRGDCMGLFHPMIDQISLPNILSVLGDPTRLAIVRYLAARENPANCGNFLDFGSKTNLSYHLAKLREAGITRTEIAGTSRLITLRRADLDQRFPGLLDSILSAAVDEAEPKISESA